MTHDANENPMIDQKTARSACAHTHVIPLRIETCGRVFEEQWRCKDCGKEFWPKPEMSIQNATIVPPPEQATLRDQFAMAALSGEFAAQGPYGVTGNHPQAMLNSARRFYYMADAMMEARK